VKIWWGMPTFMKKPGWVALANQKNYISLYTNSGTHIKDFKTRYPSIKTGKACINFKINDFIDEDAIKQVIIHAVEQKED